MTGNSGSSDDRLRVTSPSAEATVALGSVLGELLEPGDVLVLGGELGAGKTTFVSGVAGALAVEDVVWSPTFTLCRELEGDLRLAHLDLYRLETVNELEDLGLAELLDGDRVVVAEWGDVVSPAFGAERLEISFAYADEDPGTAVDDEWNTRRDVTLRAVGARWRGRWADLAEAVDRWRGEWVAPQRR